MFPTVSNCRTLHEDSLQCQLNIMYDRNGYVKFTFCKVLSWFKTSLVFFQNKSCIFSRQILSWFKTSLALFQEILSSNFTNVTFQHDCILVGEQLSLNFVTFLSSCFVTFPSGCVSENIQNLYSLVSPSILDGLTCMTHHSIQNYVLNLMTFICSWLLFTYVTMNF